MKTILNLSLILITIFLISCNKDEKVDIVGSDYLIFGHFYGECIGEGCIETYKLTDQKLYEDTNDNYSLRAKYNFVELGDDKFNETKDLPGFLPNELTALADSTFGCPDCADQGGLYIEYNQNGLVKHWRIDQSKAQVPGYLHGFMDKVNEKIKLINN